MGRVRLLPGAGWGLAGRRACRGFSWRLAAWSQRLVLGVALLVLGQAILPALGQAASPWSSLVHPAQFNPGAMLLLTDGRVLVQEQGPLGGSEKGTRGWWILTPNRYGSYVRGTWTRAASLPAGYGPISFASAVLPNGLVLIEGGEDNLGPEVWTNRGAIYNPLLNRWTAVHPPDNGAGEWSRIGDAPGAVLASGQFMLGASGYSQTTAQALFNAKTWTWSATGTGKADGNGEEGWTLLPNGHLLAVDTADAQNTELYNPSTGAWTSAGSTPSALIDAHGEEGPDLLMPDGMVLATGATGSNATYNTKTGTWGQAPSFPVIDGKQYDIADGPGAVLPDGDVLLEASPGEFTRPAHFFVFDGTTLKRVADAPESRSEASSYGYMLVLPTGQIMLDARLGSIYVYNAGGTPKRAWKPTVVSVAKRLKPGSSYLLTGRQLHGLTQGSAYGDDFQDATNYPLVRITSASSGRVFYARTSGMTSMSIAPGTQSSTYLTVPKQAPTGPATLTAVVNGIAAPPVKVTIH
jgi:hypothetical protein